MNTYTQEELEEAKIALISTLRKCEKIQDGNRLGASQRTLLDKRIRAFRLALDLIEMETANTGTIQNLGSIEHDGC